MPKILYLTYDGLTDPLGQSQILPYLEGLANRGFEITVISFEKSLVLKAKSQRLKAIQLKYHKSPPVLSTLYDLYLLRKEVKRVLKAQQIDIIHCRSYITSLVGLWAKRKYGIKFIFDMRGFWADERVEGGLWNLKNPVFKWIYQYFKKKEKEFIAEADAVIALTENAKNEILSWKSKSSVVQKFNGSIGDKITVIPTCADLDLFNPKTVSVDDSNALRDELGIQKEDFVLLYLGSLGTWYLLEEMLDFYEELKAEGSKLKGKYKFLFLTREQEMLKEAIEKRGFQVDEIIITSCARNEVPMYISICDASIFFIIPTYSKKASSATKMGEIMAMGKPVITNLGWGDVEVIISETETGVLVNDLSVEGYRKGIDRLAGSEFNPIKIRKEAGKHFSLEKGVESYHQIYLKLMEK